MAIAEGNRGAIERARHDPDARNDAIDSIEFLWPRTRTT